MITNNISDILIKELHKDFLDFGTEIRAKGIKRRFRRIKPIPFFRLW